MSILRKPLSEIGLEDLEDLVSGQARETGELEFKGDLPFRRDKNSTATADRWVEKGDRLGDFARDELLAELIAFANSDGGTLVLGLHETKSEPRRAERLEALPNCEGLAKRIVDASEDLVEPRFPFLEARAVEADRAGAGYVVFRVGKSAFGPHRLRSTREFYVRRGERTERMEVREIKDLTLNLARTGDRIEALFQEREGAAKRAFELLPHGTEAQTPALLVRATAVPLTVQSIADITLRPELWWKGRGFAASLDGKGYDCEYPAREFDASPEIALRSWKSRGWRSSSEREVVRLVRDDGVVEFFLTLEASSPDRAGRVPVGRVYVGWVLGIFAGTICQIEHLRRQLAWDAVGYGLQVEIWSGGELSLRWNDGWSHSDDAISAEPLRLPLYQVGPSDQFDMIATALVRDLNNAWGRKSTMEVSIPWNELLPD